MIRTMLIACCAALLLAGCATTASHRAFPREYALTAVRAAPAERATARGASSLRVGAVAAPAWLDGTRMYYRLRYRNDQRIAAYAESEWVAPPPAMLGAVVRNALANDGRWRGVVGPGDAASTDFVLHIRVDEFSQVFAQPGRSQGVLDVTATLVPGAGGQPLAQRRFHVEVAAATADAAGGAAALDAASTKFAAELAAWLQPAANGSRPAD